MNPCSKAGFHLPTAETPATVHPGVQNGITPTETGSGDFKAALIVRITINLLNTRTTAMDGSREMSREMSGGATMKGS